MDRNFQTAGGCHSTRQFWWSDGGFGGGLAGVWAEENSREAIFDALRRRETFATSGPRIRPRFFAGWNLPPDLCENPGFAEIGYKHGVPMGGTLGSPPSTGGAPTFVVQALADSGTATSPGNLLQRIQIVKGWYGSDDTFHQSVHEVAGSAENGATVDTATCSVSGPGHRELCGGWRDPDFDPEQRAVVRGALPARVARALDVVRVAALGHARVARTEGGKNDA